MNLKIYTMIKTICNDEFLRINETPPEFLLPFMDLNDMPGIFIYKLKEEVHNTTVITRQNLNETQFSEDSDFTGQPLECPFSIDGDTEQSTLLMPLKMKQKDKYFPLSLQEARDILWHTNFSDDVTIPICILTDGTDYKCTIMMASEKNDGWITRWWVTIDKCEDVQRLIHQHNTLSLLSPLHLQSQVSCLYLIEHGDNDSPATLVQESAGYIELHVSWKTPSVEVPLHEATTNICINVEIGHSSSEILQLWHQVIVLFDLLQLATKWKKDRALYGPYSRHDAVFPSVLQFMVDTKSVIPVSERLNELIKGNENSNGNVGITRKIENIEARQLSEVAHSVISNNNTEPEFTDKLWNLFIECSSYQDVSSCFEIVFQSIMNGARKPYIKSTNISRLSHALRSCSRDPTDFIPVLEPIEMLIEIGIEKLKKDYRNIFLISKIAPMEQLRIPILPKFADVNASNWVNVCSEWVLWFIRMHITLEMVLLTESMVKSDNCIVPITMEILKNYLAENSSIKELTDPRMITSQRFNAPINTNDVQNHLSHGNIFKSWTLRLCSETAKRRVCSIYHRTSDEIFPSAVYQYKEDKADTVNCTNGIMTEYCYSFKSISDQLLQ